MVSGRSMRRQSVRGALKCSMGFSSRMTVEGVNDWWHWVRQGRRCPGSSSGGWGRLLGAVAGGAEGSRSFCVVASLEATHTVTAGLQRWRPSGIERWREELHGGDSSSLFGARGRAIGGREEGCAVLFIG